MADLNLTGKTAVVTGGNVGIGKRIALDLAEQGADVAVTYYSHPDPSVTDAIRAMGRSAAAVRMDATDSVDVERAVEEITGALGRRIDILVTNAGGLIGRFTVAGMSDAEWHSVIDVNLSSTFYTVRAVLPYLPDNGGRIVTMSSLAAHTGGGPGAFAYAAAKAGVIALTRGLAKELAPRGVTVNCVAPGLILDTPFHEKFTPVEQQRQIIESLPLRRAGYPEDVSGAVLYLVSDLASFVTGETIEINGGAWFA